MAHQQQSAQKEWKEKSKVEVFHLHDFFTGFLFFLIDPLPESKASQMFRENIHTLQEMQK